LAKRRGGGESQETKTNKTQTTPKKRKSNGCHHGILKNALEKKKT